MGSEKPTTKKPLPHQREQTASISFWCPTVLIEKIDERVGELQKGRIARVHRSDVIKAILAKEFGVELGVPSEEGSE